jgi:hypothetical protein
LSSKRSSTPEIQQPAARLLRVIDGVELEIDENVIRILDTAEHSLHLRFLAGARAVLVEHRPPGVVVPDLDPGDDEGVHRAARLLTMASYTRAMSTGVAIAIGAVVGLVLGIVVSVATDVPLAPEIGLALGALVGWLSRRGAA